MTITADTEDLEALRAEANRRGIALATLVGEILAKKAADLRREGRPRLGAGRSGAGVSRESVEREDSPAEQ